jgi:uncharacterized protein YbjT (DUF2867 family)
VGNLCQPDSLPAILEGTEVVVDCATARPSGSLSVKQVDWDGKVALVNAARAAEVKQFIFISVLLAADFPAVPLMNYKHHVELYLKQANVPYTIFQPCGFMQGLIGQYAIPILEEQVVWTTHPPTPIAYLDTIDAARFIAQAVGRETAIQQEFPLTGAEAWAPIDVIRLCEKLSNRSAKISTMPIGLLRAARHITRFFQWSWNIADRLAFAEVLASGRPMVADMTDTYTVLDIDPDSLTSLEGYLLEYFERILKKLREQDYKKPKVSSPF